MPSGVKLTDLGHALENSMRPVVADFQRTLQQVRQLARGQRDELRVGYLGSSASRFLTPALGRLRKEHPELKFKLVDLSPAEQIASLRDGEIDVAMLGQEGASLSREFYSKKLATLGVRVAMPADHALARKRRVSLADLSDEVFIGVPDSTVPGRNEWISRLCRRLRFRPRFIREADTITETFSLIVSEGAVTLLPDYFSGDAPPGVALKPVSDAHAHWDYLVLWQRGKTPPTTRTFLNALPADR
jgi:DNA-binding transcriptional LysR family regulator